MLAHVGCGIVLAIMQNNGTNELAAHAINVTANRVRRSKTRE